jgi:hypothetical protein
MGPLARPQTWDALRGSRLALDLLEVVELAGVAAGVEWLERRGLAAVMVKRGGGAPSG